MVRRSGSRSTTQKIPTSTSKCSRCNWLVWCSVVCRWVLSRAAAILVLAMFYVVVSCAREPTAQDTTQMPRTSEPSTVSISPHTGLFFPHLKRG